MGLIKEIRALPEQIQGLAYVLGGVSKLLATLVDQQKQGGDAGTRLDALELSRAGWEAEMDAVLLKAQSTLKSAANAESRSRTMMNHAEKLADPFTEEGDEIQEGVPPEHVPFGAEEGVLDVPVDVAPLNSKALAAKLKFL